MAYTSTFTGAQMDAAFGYARKGAHTWANLDQTSVNHAATESGNISSNTDHGAGDTTMNFTASFSAATYAPLSGANGDISDGAVISLGYAGPAGALLGKATGSLRFQAKGNNGSSADLNEVNMAIVGTLA